MKDRASFYRGWVGFLIVLLVFTFLLVGFSREFLDVRIDLTEEQLHTVSPETRHILEKLEDTVTISYWVSEKLPPGFQNLRRDTVDYLEEFQRLGNGKVIVKVRDPESWIGEEVKRREEAKQAGEKEPEPPRDPFNPFGAADLTDKEKVEDEFSQQIGIPKLQGRNVQDDKLEIATFYSGMRLEHLTKEAEVMQVHQSLDGLEYELVSRIAKLTATNKPTVAFFLGKPSDVQAVPPDPRMRGMNMPEQKIHPYKPVLDHYKDYFDVVEVTLKEGSLIPAEARALIVAEPDALEERQIYEIDRYIAGGGSAIFLVAHQSGDLDNGSVIPLSISLEKLFESWGVTVRRELVGSRLCGQVVVEQPTPLGNMKMPRSFPLVPAAAGRGLNDSSPLTQGVAALTFPFASPLSHDPNKVKAQGLEITVLATTSEESWLSAFSPQLTRRMIDEPPKSQLGAYELAYLLQGNFKSLYKTGDLIPAWQKAAEPEDGDGAPEKPSDDVPPAEPTPVPELVSKPGRVVLLGSVDMGKVEYLNLNKPNVSFLQNAIESVASEYNLISIRGKTQENRALRKSDKWERNLVSYGNIIGLPLLIIAFGLARFFVRSTVSRSYEENFLRNQSSKGGAA
ncbi:MAG: GldG family protein [Planctomycetota bacterium]